MGHGVCALCRVDARFGCRRVSLLAQPDAGHFVGQLVFLVLEGQWQRQQLQPAASITAYKFNSSIARIFVNKPVNHLSTPHDSCTNNRTPRQFSFFPRQIVEISGIRLPSKTLVTAPWTPWAVGPKHYKEWSVADVGYHHPGCLCYQMLFASLF